MSNQRDSNSMDINTFAKQIAEESLEGIEFLTVVETAEEEGLDFTQEELEKAHKLAIEAKVSVGKKPPLVHVTAKKSYTREEVKYIVQKALHLIGGAWDDGNGSGLDGWIGEGRGAGEVDEEASMARARVLRKANRLLTELME